MSTTKEQIWIHGVAVQSQNPTFTVTPIGSEATVKPTVANSKTGFLHMAVPTLTITDNLATKLDAVHIRVATGTQAKITEVKVFDRMQLFADQNITGPIQTKTLDITANPRISFGICVSLFVQFQDVSANAVVRLIGIGESFRQS